MADSLAADLAGVVLAAGRGTRLRPLTLLRPKALCPVGNVALVDAAIERVGAVTAAVAVNAHHGRAAVEAHLAGRAHVSVEEDTLLGTAGALGRLRPWVGGRSVLVANADAWHRADLSAFVAGWDGERVRLLCVRDPARGDFGDLRYAGAAVLPWAVVASLPDQPAGLSSTVFAPARRAGRLDLAVHDGEYFDCGTPASYLAANLWESGGAPVVGEGAVVEGRVVRSVVWPGSRVRGSETLVDAIRAGALTVLVR
jgi:MurNAc alpha-1-phosphate uridylyltransferase